MVITNVNIRNTFAYGKVKAIVSVILNNSITINHIKVIQGDNRLYVAMPASKDSNGNFRDILHPIHTDARAEFENKILDAYKQYIGC